MNNHKELQEDKKSKIRKTFHKHAHFLCNLEFTMAAEVAF
jgi:hypothetical protein